MKLSDVYEMDVYSDGGQFLGNVKDAIVDLEHGEIGRLLMIGWSNVSEDNIQSVLKDKSVLFKNIKNIGDVVLVSTSKKDNEEASAEPPDLSFK